jgi:hypothetical protein
MEKKIIKKENTSISSKLYGVTEYKPYSRFDFILGSQQTKINCQSKK